MSVAKVVDVTNGMLKFLSSTNKTSHIDDKVSDVTLSLYLPGTAVASIVCVGVTAVSLRQMGRAFMEAADELEPQCECMNPRSGAQH